MRFFKRMLGLTLSAALGVTCLAAGAPTAAAAGTEEKIKVACVGDSITAGSGDVNWPSYLQEMLGDGYEVKNFGLGGAAVRLLKNDGTRDPFWQDSTQYRESKEYGADIVIFMMGTNDGGANNYQHIDEYYKNDFKTLVQPYLDAGSKLYIATSPHAYSMLMSDVRNVNERIRQMQIELAEELDVPLVDMNTMTADMPECFPDGLHGNSGGYMVIAAGFYEQVFNSPNGALVETTIQTAPGARVAMGRNLRIADENGEVKFKSMPGTYEVEVLLDGYKRLTDTVELTQSTTLQYTLEAGDLVVSAGKPATASSTQSGHTPDKAFDGQTDGDASRWESEAKDPSWLYVDLEAPTAITGVRLYWEAAYASAYEIQVSDDAETWTTMVKVTDGAGGLVQHDFEQEITARYVRIYGTRRATIFAYSIYEMQVLAAAGGETPGTDPGETPDDKPGETPDDNPSETPNDEPEVPQTGAAFPMMAAGCAALGAVCTVVTMRRKEN